jgi:hypothetical protein
MCYSVRGSLFVLLTQYVRVRPQNEDDADQNATFMVSTGSIGTATIEFYCSQYILFIYSRLAPPSVQQIIKFNYYKSNHE